MGQIVGCFTNGSPIYKDDLTHKSVFINCDFRHSDLSELDLKSMNFFQCEFTGASFRESKFTDVKFRSCVLDDIDAYSTHFIGVTFSRISMQRSLLTKAKFLITHWSSVDISGSKIFDLDMQETDSGSCILGFQKDVIGQPKQLLDRYFTVDADTPMAALLGKGAVKRITNSVIEEHISKSKKIYKRLFRFLSRILGLRTVNSYDGEYMRNSEWEWLQKDLDKIRKT